MNTKLIIEDQIADYGKKITLLFDPTDLRNVKDTRMADMAKEVWKKSGRIADALFYLSEVVDSFEPKLVEKE